MISTRQPQRGIALHALVADNDILQRFVQGVAHMELSGDVRGRDHDGERLPVGVNDAPEVSALLPVIVYLFLNFARFVDLGHALSFVH